MKTDLRLHQRSPLGGRLVLEWTDENQCVQQMRASARNISRGGIMVRAFHPLPVGSLVRIRSKNLFFLAGCARVEHCARRGFTYVIGLRFYNDLAERYSMAGGSEVEDPESVSAPQK